MMGNYGTQRDHKKAWLLLDNSSTHYVDGLEAKVWEADGFQFEGFIMSHTNILFLPPNTTSKIQPLDAGIIACWKAYCRNLQINTMLTVLEDLLCYSERCEDRYQTGHNMGCSGLEDQSNMSDHTELLEEDQTPSCSISRS